VRASDFGRAAQQQLDGGAQRLDRIGLGVRSSGDLDGGAARRILEEGKRELVLSVEVLVEAAQRLPRAVDDLLDGEVGRALVRDDGPRGVRSRSRSRRTGRPVRVRRARSRSGTEPEGLIPGEGFESNRCTNHS
jgi:hypothetical protein